MKSTSSGSKKTGEEKKTVINDVDEEEGSDLNEMDESANDSSSNQMKEFSIADVLTELDKTKREL